MSGSLELYIYQFSSVQSLSRVRLFATPWTAARQASLSITNSRGWLKLMSIESVMPSNHLLLSSPSLPAFNLSQHQGLFKRVSSSLCVYIQFSQQPFTSYSLEIKAHRGSPTCPKLDSEWRKQHFHPCDLAPVCAVNHCTPKILKIKMLPQQCLNSRAPSIIPKWLPFSSFTE